MDLRSGRRLRSSGQMPTMQLRSGRRLPSSEQLSAGGEDCISALPDDLLLLVLASLGCFRSAVRTGVLARRWHGLWATIRDVVLRGVPLSSLEEAIEGVPAPPPAVSLLEIHVPRRRARKRGTRESRLLHAASVLRAAARLEPEKLVFVLTSDFMGQTSPMFFLRLPPFRALETLSLSGCISPFRSMLSSCPRLRVLRLQFNGNGFLHGLETFMSVHSASLQELSVEAENVCIDTVDLVAPKLKQLTVSLKAHREVNISILAPMLEKFSWQWSYHFDIIKFGLWQVVKLRLQTAERQGELPSLQILASITPSIVHGEVENSLQEIEKHLVAKFCVIELYVPKGHVFGAFVFQLLGMNPSFRATQRLKVILQGSELKQECPLDCACDHPNWRTQTISLTALENVEIYGFEGYDDEIDFLKLIFKCAPMLKRMIVALSHKVSLPDDGCTQIQDIFRAYPSVESYLFLALG